MRIKTKNNMVCNDLETKVEKFLFDAIRDVIGYLSHK